MLSDQPMTSAQEGRKHRVPRAGYRAGCVGHVRYLSELHDIAINTAFFTVFDDNGQILLASDWLLDQTEVVPLFRPQYGSNWFFVSADRGGHAQTWRVRRSRKTEGRECPRVGAPAGRLSEGRPKLDAVGDAAISFNPIGFTRFIQCVVVKLVRPRCVRRIEFRRRPFVFRCRCVTFIYSETNRSGVYNAAHSK
jgi:hypothetical protein